MCMMEGARAIGVEQGAGVGSIGFDPAIELRVHGSEAWIADDDSVAQHLEVPR
jgi:hypothetical protein